MPDPVVRYDSTTRLLYANTAYIKISGIALTQQLGKTPVELRHYGEDTEFFQQKLQEVAATGIGIREIFRWSSAEGKTCWFDASFVPEKDATGELASVVVFMRDITAHKEVELQSVQREERFRAIVEHMPDSIARYDRGLRRLFVNSTLVEEAGRPATQLLGCRPEESPILEPTASACLQQLIEKVMKTGEPVEVELPLQLQNGIKRWDEMRIFPEFGEGRRVETVLVIGRDVTRRRAAEEAHFKREREFRSLADNSPDYIVRYDRACRRVYVNPVMARQAGVPPEALLGTSPAEGSAMGEQTGHFIQKLKSVFATGNVEEFEYTLPVGDGTFGSVLIRFIPEFDRDERVETVLAVGHDITAFKEADRQQQAREREFRTLVDHSSDITLRHDMEGRCVFINRAYLALTRFSADDVLYAPLEKVDILGAGSVAYMQMIQKVKAEGRQMSSQIEWATPGSDRHIHHLHFIPEFDQFGRMESILVIGRDISELVEAKEYIDKAEAAANMGSWYCDLLGKTCHLSRGAIRILNRPVSRNLTPKQALALLPQDQKLELMLVLQRAFAARRSEIIVECSFPDRKGRQHVLCPVSIEYREDGVPWKLAGLIQDISTTRSYQRQVHTLAYRDSLTGLPNRNLFTDRFRQAAIEAGSKGQKLGFMLLDLDNFKTINDTHGHGFGDRLLFVVGERLQDTFREYDTLARMGGDEFALLLPHVQDVGDIEVVARKVVSLFSMPFMVDGLELFTSCSIGVAVYPLDGENLEELLKNADAAMYHAKDQGRNNYQFYLKQMTSSMVERTFIESEMRQALQYNELSLYYQPQIDLASDSICGAEALIRWNHPTLGVVPPERFIGIAEETGLILELGGWILRQACAAISAWNRGRGSAIIRGSVNLSPRQFQMGDLVDIVCQALKAAQCRPEWVELEITESVFLEGTETTCAALEKLRSMGVTIAIDDFGTGYSSLSYLAGFPVDALKIDRMFIRDVTTNDDRAELVKAIITMGKSLKTTLVAEGVETKEQESFLKALACPVAQGFLYAKPLPLNAFMALLNSQK